MSRKEGCFVTKNPSVKVSLDEEMKYKILNWLADLRGNRKLETILDVKNIRDNKVTIEFDLSADGTEHFKAEKV